MLPKLEIEILHLPFIIVRPLENSIENLHLN